MANRKIGLIVIVVAVTVSISAANNPRKSTLSDKVVFENREYHKQYIDPDSSRLYVDIFYPAILSAPTVNAKNAVNQYIKEALLNEANIGKRAESFDDLFSSYLRDFSEEQRFRAQEGEGPRDWQYKDSVWIASDNSGILSIAFDYVRITGGARPFYGRNYANFDTHYGSQVYLEEILKEGYKNILEKIVYTHFRKVEKNISVDSSLEDTSSGAEETGIQLTENYSIGKEGITFYYNPGEIEAEAIGPIALMIKYEEIKDLLDEKGLLKRQSR